MWISRNEKQKKAEATIVGYAEGISAGTDTLTTNYAPFLIGMPACCRPAKYLIEIEELP